MARAMVPETAAIGTAFAQPDAIEVSFLRGAILRPRLSTRPWSNLILDAGQYLIAGEATRDGWDVSLGWVLWSFLAGFNFRLHRSHRFLLLYPNSLSDQDHKLSSTLWTFSPHMARGKRDERREALAHNGISSTNHPHSLTQTYSPDAWGAMTQSPVRSPQLMEHAAPNQQATAPIPDSIEGTAFPRGQCRYILMVPHLKGQRCACVSFTHNTTMPGATCNCGHLSCFHMTQVDPAPPGENRDEINSLGKRLDILEKQAIIGDGGSIDRLLVRMGGLEEMVQNATEDFHAEIKGSYRSISGAWQLVEKLQKQVKSLEDVCRAQSAQVESAITEIKDLRNRHLELLDSDESLEERIEKLENADNALSSLQDECSDDKKNHENLHGRHQPSIPKENFPKKSVEVSSNIRASMVPRDDASRPSPWTIHVSLLPNKHQERPFEKDSRPYKRILSRGLQRMVAVDVTNGETFAAAVTRSFRDALQGQPWEPLQEASPAAGASSPTLQRLANSASLESSDRTVLEHMCASPKNASQIEAIYVAPSRRPLSWAQIHQLPIHTEGLESSWAHDDILDGRAEVTLPQITTESSRQIQALCCASQPQGTLKRPITDISRVSRVNGIFLPEEEKGTRAKMPRICKSVVMGLPRSMERRSAV